jgi:hypothetical protein
MSKSPFKEIINLMRMKQKSYMNIMEIQKRHFKHLKIVKSALIKV